MLETTPFKVAAVSENANSFGLRQIVVVNREGEAYAIHRHDPPDKGSLLHLPVVGGAVTSTSGYHFEIPQKLSKAPQSVIDELWASQPASKL
jgi:hypothetical protein